MRREIKGRALGATIQTKKSDESSKTYWTHDNIFISTKKYKKSLNRVQSNFQKPFTPLETTHSIIEGTW
jgi:hypothetical protein